MDEVQETGKPRRIAIIGAGFCGSLTAVQLLRQAREPIEIVLFEREGGRLGKGLAYGTTDDCHLLNVPAGKMSALPDEPDHFIDWVRRQGGLPNAEPQAFLQRRLYGTYIRSLLLDSVAACQGTHQITVIEDEVIDIASGPRDLTLHCRSGARYTAAQAVLALGNFPPGDPPETAGHRGYHPNPWREHALPSLLQSRSCLMIGSGLTMLDLVMSMHERRYQGVIHVVSRRGLMPQAHRPASIVADIAAVQTGAGPRELTRVIRGLVKDYGGDWRAVIDAMRPHNPDIWQSWSLPDRLRFIRHVRPYWENRRHRSATTLIARFEALVSDGRVQMHQGRVGTIREEGEELLVSLKSRGETREIQVESVANCTGAECNFRKLGSELVQNLLTRGMTACDPVGFGITVASYGALRDNEGHLSDRLFTLGPPMKGTLWETTAVPELRQQAAAIATRLLA
ncbi:MULTISPECIES: FAD/NAD(P)-binding protein [unclassified Achromobacter]|uniref:FAD/NAD(P)-binding protein n=1 Tax=unclassified Achromobacter TaxID=2626865 RepID=UPI0013036433|nr:MULTISPECIES: FAD/NAD(P)-binding protein [unclassified Achromobacter]